MHILVYNINTKGGKDHGVLYQPDAFRWAVLASGVEAPSHFPFYWLILHIMFFLVIFLTKLAVTRKALYQSPLPPHLLLVDEKDPCALIACVHIALHAQIIFFFLFVFLTKFAFLT